MLTNADPTGLFNEMLTLTTRLFFQREFDLILREKLAGAASVLDIGCGNGAYLEAIRSQAPLLRCVGLEKDERIYPYAAARTAPGLQFIRTDYRDQRPWDKPFDVVIARLVVLHLPDPAHFLAWLRDVTRSASTVIILDLDDVATGPLPSDGLPLYESLFRASRRPLLDRLKGQPADRLIDFISSDDGYRANKLAYRIAADDIASKRLMAQYMERVTRLMQGGRLSDERKLELDGWVNDDRQAYEVGMFAITMQRT